MTDIADQITAEFQTTTSRGVRSAFQSIDLTQLDSNTYRFPVQQQKPVPNVVAEGEEMPRDDETYEEYEMVFEKYGFEVTDEGDAETIRNKVVNNVVTLEAMIARRAADEIYDNVGASSVVVNDDEEALMDALFEGQSKIAADKVDMIVVPQLLADSLADGDDREWEEIAADFETDSWASVVVDPYNVLRGSEVLVVDSDYFGYEGARTGLKTRSYTEYEQYDSQAEDPIPEDEREIMREVTQAFLRLGFIVIDDSAAHRCQLIR